MVAQETALWLGHVLAGGSSQRWDIVKLVLIKKEDVDVNLANGLHSIRH